MSKTIFEFISDVFEKKTPWNSLSETDKKSYNSYMMNRWISMNPDYIDFINMIQPYTIGVLAPRESYKLLQGILPQSKLFVKYIKAESTNSKDFNDNLISFIANKMQWSEYQTVQHLSFIMKMENGNECIKEFVCTYGYDEKSLKKEFGLK